LATSWTTRGGTQTDSPAGITERICWPAGRTRTSTSEPATTVYAAAESPWSCRAVPWPTGQVSSQTSKLSSPCSWAHQRDSGGKRSRGRHRPGSADIRRTTVTSSSMSRGRVGTPYCASTGMSFQRAVQQQRLGLWPGCATLNNRRKGRAGGRCATGAQETRRQRTCFLCTTLMGRLSTVPVGKIGRGRCHGRNAAGSRAAEPGWGSRGHAGPGPRRAEARRVPGLRTSGLPVARKGSAAVRVGVIHVAPSGRRIEVVAPAPRGRLDCAALKPEQRVNQGVEIFVRVVERE